MTSPMMRLKTTRRSDVLAAILLLTAAGCAARDAAPPAADATRAALDAGNRLFRAGEVDAAVVAYLDGYSPRAPHPTLLYNLGTALHHAGRLPEAILWYRRAARAKTPSLWRAATSNAPLLWRAGDPWLEENLWLARRSLGSQALPPTGLPGWLAGHTGGLRWAAIAIAWIILLLVVTRDGMPLRGVLAAAALAIALYGGAAAVERWGPRPAVILEDCPTPAGTLPAGTEAWVHPGTGAWRISGSGNRSCPPDALEPVW